MKHLNCSFLQMLLCTVLIYTQFYLRLCCLFSSIFVASILFGLRNLH